LSSVPAADAVAGLLNRNIQDHYKMASTKHVFRYPLHQCDLSGLWKEYMILDLGEAKINTCYV
jgi:hypothetical protein